MEFVEFGLEGSDMAVLVGFGFFQGGQNVNLGLFGVIFVSLVINGHHRQGRCTRCFKGYIAFLFSKNGHFQRVVKQFWRFIPNTV
jgi:hypothetical protein